MTASLHVQVASAEGLRQAAEWKERKAEDGRLVAQARVRLLEGILADVWRWTNDGAPHLELLRPVLLRADAEYSLLAELDELEAKRRPKRGKFHA